MTHNAESVPPTADPRPLIKPLLVQFWRCGKVYKGRGWSRCPSPDFCNNSGCVRAFLRQAQIDSSSAGAEAQQHRLRSGHAENMGNRDGAASPARNDSSGS